MSFTEVVFELTDPHHPMCRLTAPPHRGQAVYRILDTGEVTRQQRAHLVYRGPSEARHEVERIMRLRRPDGTVEPLDEKGDDLSLAIHTPLDTHPAPAGLAAILPTLAAAGLPVVLDPICATDGAVTVRMVVLRAVDAQEVLRALQDVQRAAGFFDLKIHRIVPLAPATHVESARRALPPEQEALLALAASMGYYASPKGVTLEAIARAVGLSISPVHKRLKAAEETIVAQHVAPRAPTAAKRRARNPRPDHQTERSWQVHLRVRGEVGPSDIVAQTPSARAVIHPLSHDGTRMQSSLLVLLAPDEAQTKLLASLQDRPDIAAVHVVDRSGNHVAARLMTGERGAYSLSWWSAAWGLDATLRSMVVDAGETTIRAIVHRPHTPQQVDERLQDCARLAGWRDWTVTDVREILGTTPLAAWPEPLTPRQLEVLRVAHALGYYRTPRGCTLEQVAGTLGVSANAIHKNLVLAESKLINAYLAAGM